MTLQPQQVARLESPPTLVGSRCTLRPLRPGDAPALQRHAPIFAWNEGSQGVARKCGYQLEGAMPQSAIKDGRVIDRVVYASYRRDRA